MPTVKCDVCGGIFNKSHLGSHKRLAHNKNGPSAVAPMTKKEAIEKIVSLYESLSIEDRRRVVRLLTAKEQKDQKVQTDQKIQ